MALASYHGLGDYQSLNLALQSVGAATPAVMGTLVATHVLAASTVGGPVGIAIGAAVAGVSILISQLFKPDTDKIYATNIVNAVEPYMKQNLAAWQGSTKTRSEQQVCLANFDYLWQRVVSSCQGNYGSAGVACVADRQRGGKWDWFAYYRDPIANDPNVVDDPGALSSAFQSATGISLSPMLLLGGGLILLGLVV